MTLAGSEFYTSVRTRALGRMGLGGAAVGGARTKAVTVMDTAQTPESEFEVTVSEDVYTLVHMIYLSRSGYTQVYQICIPSHTCVYPVHLHILE